MKRVSDEWLIDMIRLYNAVCSSEGNLKMYGALYELKQRREAEGPIDMEGVVDLWIDDVLSSADGGEIMRRSYISVRQALIELQSRRKAEKEHGHTDHSASEKDGAGATRENAVLPIPCTKGFEDWTVKRWFAKINEELDEMKNSVLMPVGLDWRPDSERFDGTGVREITGAAADTITAITSMLEAMGIDEQQRQAAQRRVNEMNKERNRL